MKKTKKLLAILLAVFLLAGMFPCALAAETVDSGKCGENASWTLDSDGVLTISGTGMAEITDREKWETVKTNAVTAVVEDGITVIGGSLFSGFEKLTQVTLPESVDKIYYQAFADSTALETVTLPSEVSEMSSSVFENCQSLKDITLPRGISSVPFATFRTSGVESVTIPDTVTDIMDDTFMYCSRLEKVTVPASVKTILGRAFAWSGLKEIRFEGDAPRIYDNAFDMVKADAYYPQGNTTWSGAQLPYGGSLTWGTFDPETGETTVDPLPQGIKAKGTLGDSITWTFSDDNVLTVSGSGSIQVGEGQQYPWKQLGGEVAKIIIEDGITTVGGSAFEAFTAVTETVLGDTVEEIGDHAFYDCLKLEKINLPDSLKAIGNAAFWRCGITALDIPSGVTSIAPWAFASCSAISGTVVIPKGITRVEESAFMYCEGINRIVLPDTIEVLGNSAFFRCSSLTDIDLPEGLKIIERAAFCECRSLETVTIPDGVTLIDGAAFAQCGKLTQIIFDGDAPQIGEDAFSDVTAEVYIPMNNDTWTDDMTQQYGGTLKWYEYDPDYVPSVIDSGMIGDVKWEYYDNGELAITGNGEIPDYTAADGANPVPWTKYGEDTYIIYIDEGITAVGANAFNGFTALEEVYFLGDAPRIADSAFIGVSAYAEFYIFADGWTEEVLLGYGGDLEWLYIYLRGDVDADGEYTNADLVMMARYLVGLCQRDSDEYAAVTDYGDIDRDNKVTNTDLVSLARKIVGLE